MVSTSGLFNDFNDHGAVSKTMKWPESGERKRKAEKTESDVQDDPDIPAWKWSDYEPDWWDDIEPLDQELSEEEE